MNTQPFQQKFEFSIAGEAIEDDEALIVDLEGFEGPLHVLLALARTQKVDLLKLSILKLAEQYLAFVQTARRRNFALAADYLVMAAWLTYLKSRLLLPRRERPAREEPPPEEAAQILAFRLAKLDAMRRAVEALGQRPQLGLNVFVRGDPDAVKVVSHRPANGDLYGLMKAYSDQRKSQHARYYTPRIPPAYALEDARVRLRGLMPELKSWQALSGIAPVPPEDDGGGPSRASYLASTLSASLELVKEGALEARQMEAFADLYLRTRLRLEGET